MPTKTTPKDFFLNLGAIVTLYFSVISILDLIFTIINKYFPDAISYGYSSDLYTVRWTISALIILYPIYLYLSHLVNKDIAAFPEKKEIWIKKWSSYLTLFLTGATIAVDLIILINKFLGGEITTRFILKVIVVLIVTSFVFSYYLYDLKKSAPGDSRPKTIAIIASIVVLLCIIGGFFAAGSPFNERLRRFDDRRVEDLSSIQYQITNYWQKKGELPLALADLKDPLSGVIIPTDPETKVMYEYTKKDKMVFELCANFSLPSRTDQSQPYIYSSGKSDSFSHDAGRKCFERKIDPALYPVNPPNGIPTPVPIKN